MEISDNELKLGMIAGAVVLGLGALVIDGQEAEVIVTGIVGILTFAAGYLFASSKTIGEPNDPEKDD